MRFERPTKPVTCTCYKCTSPVYQWDQQTATKRIYNNVHGHLQACGNCGRPKSEYVDNYTKGHYECWWCNERSAGPFGPEPAPPTGAL